jgi:hypothetical protein
MMNLPAVVMALRDGRQVSNDEVVCRVFFTCYKPKPTVFNIYK